MKHSKFSTLLCSPENGGSQNNTQHEAPSPGNGKDGGRMILAPKHIILSVIIFTLMTISAYAEGVSALLSTFFAVPLFSILSYMLGNRFFLLLPLISIVSGFIAGGIGGILSVLMISAMSYGLSNAILEKPGTCKTSAVVRCTVVILAVSAAQFLISVYITKIFTVRDFFTIINSAFDAMKMNLVSSYSEILKITGDSAVFTAAEFESMADALILRTKSVLPAVYVIFCTAISYISVSLLSPLAKLTKTHDMFGSARFEITVTPFPAAIYLISSVAILFTSEYADFGLYNITYILSPVLCLCGLKHIIVFFRKKDVPDIACKMIAAALAFVALMLGDIGFTILVLAGMMYSLSPENKRQ